MTDDDLYTLIGQLQRHEGVRLKPYRDTVGKLTIGVGRNLEDVGISEEESDMLLSNDIGTRGNDLVRVFPWFRALDSVRQCAMVEFCFIGITKLLTFEKALRAMAAGDYETAADEFYDSNIPKPWQWGPERTSRVCAQLRTGRWQS